MNWPRTIFEILCPAELNDLNVEELAIALNNPAVRNRWLQDVLEDLRRLNLHVDKLLERNEPQHKFVEVSARRRQTWAILQQIQLAKNSVEMDSGHNPMEDLDHVAVDPAPGR